MTKMEATVHVEFELLEGSSEQYGNHGPDRRRWCAKNYLRWLLSPSTAGPPMMLGNMRELVPRCLLVFE